MRVLIDECAPSELKKVLIENGFECFTAQDAGWAGKENGELLALANVEFEAFVTLDRKLRYQQNLFGLKIAIIVLRSHSNRLEHLRPSFQSCIETLRSIQTGIIVEIGPSS